MTEEKNDLRRTSGFSDHLKLSWTEKEMPQRERTKHVHGLHPYLGKYIPQLVEHFLKNYFKPGDIVLDPFVGSGTTVIEANILGIDSLGVDISAFNILLCKVKAADYDFKLLTKEIRDITRRVKQFSELTKKKDTEPFVKFLPDYSEEPVDFPAHMSEYIKEWYTLESQRELLYYKELIPEYHYQDVLKVILTRSARSARLAPHFELDWPKKPVTEPYYCKKHARICYPTSGAYKFLKTYGEDTIKRLKKFAELKTEAKMSFIHGDSRTANFGQKITGVMTSPPYVGVIDYHLQHQYAYEFLELEDLREKEIGPRKKGNSKTAQKNYMADIEAVMKNCLKQMDETNQGPLIFVVNDKNNLYEEICERVGLTISERIMRKVDRRSGRRASEYFEEILILRS
ncbi:MAG: site-specific DNA-methyltransferase [Candidatus Heimdallarchaeota archaeon]|nr:site-specific DNA-methyltransferase [Candidatus Heimdallarchaeota archaeon]